MSKLSYEIRMADAGKATKEQVDPNEETGTVKGIRMIYPRICTSLRK
jgi:hypothetical protein